MLTAAAIAVYVVVLVAAGISDLRRYEIPNALSVLLLAAFAGALPALPLATLAGHLSAGAAVFAAGSLLFFTGVWGGGDAKLVAAASVWIGWRELAAFVLLIAILGAVLALILLSLRRLLAGHPTEGRWYRRLLSHGEGIPYGVAIAAAALALTPHLSVLDPASLG